MVNYYQVWNISQEFKEDQKENVSIVIDFQKMRERNNEASKRCRLKRRIKQVINKTPGYFVKLFCHYGKQNKTPRSFCEDFSLMENNMNKTKGIFCEVFSLMENNMNRTPGIFLKFILNIEDNMNKTP